MIEPDTLEAAQRWEEEWSPKVGGEPTKELRFMVGIMCGRIVQLGVDPALLAEYIRQAITTLPAPPALPVPQRPV